MVMIYPYKCDCGFYKEEIKPVSQHTSVISCTACPSTMYQVYSIAKPTVDKMEAEYYPSLGTVVKSKRHRAELMKAKGLIEVGNEKPQTVHKEMESQLRSNRKQY
jgi:hypothetical protein